MYGQFEFHLLKNNIHEQSHQNENTPNKTG